MQYKTRFLFVDYSGGKGVLPWFDGFVYETIVPACILSPLRPTFDLRDAQTVLVSNVQLLTLIMTICC